MLTTRQTETIAALRQGAEAFKGAKDFRTRLINVQAADVLEVVEATDALQQEIAVLKAENAALKDALKDEAEPA